MERFAPMPPADAAMPEYTRLAVFGLLREFEVGCIQGNYDHSLGNDLADCQCGYTDPRDNYFARISYDYTFQKTSPAHRAWMRELPAQRRIQLGRFTVLM